MSACRICLALKPRKDITELSDRKYGGSKSYEEIISFCLGIEVEQDLKVCSKLCTKCYNKVLEFHQFKSLALQNENHWKSLDDKVGNSICTVLKDETPKDVIKTENESESDEDGIDKSDALDNGFEVAIKEEFKPEKDSDDELLSDMKNIKYEFIQNKEEEDIVPESVQVKKCRGPSKTTIVPRTKQDKKVGPWKECQECGKTVRYLTDHMQIHLPPEQRRQLKCDLCDRVFATPSSRYLHRQRAHLTVKQECDICHKSVLHLRQHKLLHKPENLKLVCAICGRKFLCKANLDTHMAIHSKDRPYECDICGSRFRLKYCMERHKRSIHDSEKSHLCHYCSKGFFKLFDLQIHLRSHTKETPYSCAKCNKTFKTSGTLRAHQSIHSEVRAFACKLCDMTFARKNAPAHYKKCTSDTHNWMPMCISCNVLVYYLMAHMQSHIKEKKFSCQYCDVSFHRSDHRKRHEFTAHLKHVAIAAYVAVDKKILPIY